MKIIKFARKNSKTNHISFAVGLLLLLIMLLAGIYYLTTQHQSMAATLAVGANYVCWIDEQQKTWCWGQNLQGQLGNAQTKPFSVASQIKTSGQSLVKIVAFDHRTCGIDQVGEVYCWGGWYYLDEPLPSDMQQWLSKHKCSIQPEKVLGLPVPTKQLGLGARHTCALLVNNQVWCWGDNGLGQQASPKNIEFVAMPQQVQGLAQVKSGLNWLPIRPIPVSSVAIMKRGAGGWT